MNSKKRISEKEIDGIVVNQVDDDSAWEEPTRVYWEKLSLESLPFPVPLPCGIVKKADFLARLHGESNLEIWLTHIIQEQMDFETDVLSSLEPNISLPYEFADRVAFFAKRHQETNKAFWVARVIQERVESEEKEFNRLKRELVGKKNV